MIENCVICHEPLEQDVYITKCGHKYHGECITNYCKSVNHKSDMNFSFIECPLCKTVLNCRLHGGDDIFPYEEIEKENIPPNTSSIVDQALQIIDADEYELIESPDDIYVPELNLTNNDKELVFQKIQKLKKGGTKRRNKRYKRRTKRCKRRTKRCKRRTKRRTKRCKKRTK